MNEDLKQFLIKYRRHLIDNNLDEIYKRAAKENIVESLITKFFLSKDIDIFKYLTKIPSNCFSIFSYEQINNIVIPKNITEIERLGFSNCRGVKNIKILSNITTIEYGVFMGCVNLKSIKLPNSVEEIKGLAFYNCKSLKNINIPKNLKYVNPNAFDGCLLEIQEKFKPYMN